VTGVAGLILKERDSGKIYAVISLFDAPDKLWQIHSCAHACSCQGVKAKCCFYELSSYKICKLPSTVLDYLKTLIEIVK